MSDPTKPVESPAQTATRPAHVEPRHAAGSVAMSVWEDRALSFDSDAFKLTLEPRTFEELKVWATMFAETGMFRCRDPRDAMIRIATGRGLGLPMYASMKGLYSVESGDQGRSVGIEAKLKHALANRLACCEYVKPIERSATKATWAAKRRGQDEVRISFTIEDAIAAELLDRGKDGDAKKKNNYNRYAADMLSSKARARVIDDVFPEAALGLATAEDLIEEAARDRAAIETSGEDVTDRPAPPQPPPVQAAPPRDFEREASDLKVRIAAAVGASPDEQKKMRSAVAGFLQEPGAFAYMDDIKATFQAHHARQKPQGAPATDAPRALAPEPEPVQARPQPGSPSAATRPRTVDDNTLFGDPPPAGR